MIASYADALQVTGAAGPWLALALVLLGIAARVARSARASALRQGERIGQLEKRADSERNRRQQVEAELTRLGIRLPWWPPDGRPWDGPWQEPSYATDDDDDQDDDGGPATSEAPRVPPLPAFPRHRRTAPA